ncbi:mucosal pentraxin-like [Ahaetulla prasina]|uniref:mucosal pentraxin-like n=1 Tax=Ahaetulla prasina TaxID=499056 RepID=UPI00264851EE|nr:mucosal pentraxin-like [Ahaetulla prasina]
MEKDRLLLCTVLVIFSIPGIWTNTDEASFHDLEGKAFVFPKPSADSYVLLKPKLDQNLRQLTLCLRFFTDLTRGFSLFSAASRDHDNEILLFRNPHDFEMWVGGEYVSFSLSPLLEIFHLRSELVCTTWDSATGIIQLWLDGQRLPRRGAMKGYEVKTDLVVMLGQDQDSYGGKLDVKQSFVGEISEVYLWDKVLPAEELTDFQTPITPNPKVNWTLLKFEIRGYVQTELL